MSISGNLRTMPFGDLMQWISMSRKTGTLVIKGHPYTKKILFREGVVSAVTSNNPREHLGYYLVGWGCLTEQELQEMLERQKKANVMLGELLVQLSRLSRDEVDYLVRMKTEETIFELMTWDEGEFFFLDDAHPRRDFKELNLTVDHFLLEGSRQLDERRQIRGLVPDASYVPCLKQPVDDKQLAPVGAAIVRAIDGSRTIADIALSCRVPEFPVMMFIHEGIKSGVFDLLPPGAVPRQMPGLAKSSSRDLLREAENALALQDLIEAYRQITLVRTSFASDPGALEGADAIERELIAELAKVKMGPNIVLELALSQKDLMQLNCAPEEAYVLSRINGIYTVPQILTLLPGAKLFNQLIIHGLLQRGIVKLRESQAVVRYSSVRFSGS
jgi:hypothetical protein